MLGALREPVDAHRDVRATLERAAAWHERAHAQWCNVGEAEAGFRCGGAAVDPTIGADGERGVTVAGWRLAFETRPAASVPARKTRRHGPLAEEARGRSRLCVEIVAIDEHTRAAAARSKGGREGGDDRRVLEAEGGD